MEAKSIKSLIASADFCRISRVISTVLTAAGAETEGACTFFAIAGAAILRTHYKLEAMPVAGAAAYAVGFGRDHDVVATFGKLEGDHFFATSEAFHCWIECNGVVLDFMAPIFEENLRSSGIDASVPRRVFQKPLTAMNATLPQEFREGAFYLVPSRELTEGIYERFRNGNLAQDLVNVCLHWFRRPPKPMDEVFGMLDEKGTLTALKLQPLDISGCW
jgi:Protein of unknown function (DUF2026)